jgi:DNA-binding NarL/FixJ family response regulator
MINVIIADNNEIVLESLRIVLDHSNDIKVVATAKDGCEAVKLANQLVPDLVLMDINMPVCDGIRGTRLIKEQNKRIKVVIHTKTEVDYYISEALKFGADGYVLKNVGADNLIKVIKTIMAGFSIVQNSMFDKFRKKYETLSCKCFTDNQQPHIKLTRREKEVLSLVGIGMTNKEIAGKLFLAHGSVKNIISSLFIKLNVEDRTQLAICAIKQNMV